MSSEEGDFRQEKNLSGRTLGERTQGGHRCLFTREVCNQMKLVVNDGGGHVKRKYLDFRRAL